MTDQTSTTSSTNDPDSSFTVPHNLISRLQETMLERMQKQMDNVMVTVANAVVSTAVQAVTTSFEIAASQSLTKEFAKPTCEWCSTTGAKLRCTATAAPGEKMCKPHLAYIKRPYVSKKRKRNEDKSEDEQSEHSDEVQEEEEVLIPKTKKSKKQPQQQPTFPEQHNQPPEQRQYRQPQPQHMNLPPIRDTFPELFRTDQSVQPLSPTAGISQLLADTQLNETEDQDKGVASDEDDSNEDNDNDDEKKDRHRKYVLEI